MARELSIEELTAAWDGAAALIERDDSRILRYQKCFRYFVGRVGADARICDVGCGEGTGLLLLQRLGFESLTGVEVSGERLEQARALLGAAPTLVHVAPDAPLPFADGTFDVVLSAAVVEHTLDPAAHIRELARVTRAGGSVVIASDCYTFRILQLLGLYRTVQPVDRALFPVTFVRYFAAGGLELVHSEGFVASGGPYLLLRRLVNATGVRALGRRVLPQPIQRRIVRMKARNARVSSVDNSAPGPVSGAQVEPWQPNHWLRALPKVAFSEENVFFLEKPGISDPTDQSSSA